MSPTILTRKDKRRGTTTQSLYFRTLAMPCLNDYYDLFYKERVKVIPRNLSTLLTARGLAYWIMDDGGKSVYNQTILHTRSFMLEKVKYLQSVLSENFGLVTRLEEKKKDKWVIYIPVRQVTKLKDIVGPYMNESMLYKI
uniref:LAGLIDADG endonuclease n=1 Tax=Bipolaris cookei TaxID=74410 RepID=A0A2H4NRV2_9PLEO|nr:LAGLIDADG endonuclease [Bipolaris cookei]ATV95718.1 LAGLIDADG endonuclease [Bipolaris cookei]